MKKMNKKSFAMRLATTDEQISAIKTIEKWLEKMNLRIVTGTCIGKNFETAVLDLTYGGGEIHVRANGWEDTDLGQPGVTVNGVHIKSSKDVKTFKTEVRKVLNK